MRFLVDNALSPRFAHQLVLSGHDAVHVRDLGMAAADDSEVLELALSDDRILVSADTDFGKLLASRQLTKPSFILFRGDAERRPELQAQLLNQILPDFEGALREGAVLSITRDRIRAHTLPIR
jgi:predicted nuclease of predicted toxin-antitoxin system